MVFESLSAWETIVAVSADAVVAFDSRFRIVRCNEQAESLFGFKADEAIGEMVDVLIPERLRQGHRGMIKQFGNGPEEFKPLGSRTELVVLAWDRTEIPVGIGIWKIKSDSERLYVAILRDLRPSRNAEEAVARSEQRYQKLFEDAPIAMWELDFTVVADWIGALPVCDPAGVTEYLLTHPDRVVEGIKLATVRAVNQAGREQLGRDNDDASGSEMLTLLAGTAPGGFAEQFGAIATGVESITLEVLHRNFGANRVIRVHQVIPVEDGQLDLTRVIVSLVDLSAERKAEQLLEESLTELEKERDRFERMFEYSPAAIRLTDHRLAVDSIEELRLEGVSDFDVYAREHPEEVEAVVSQTIVTAANPAAVELFGSRNSRVVGPVSDLPSMVGSDPELTRAIFVALAARQSDFELKGRFERSDGEVRHLQVAVVVPTVAGRLDYSNTVVTFQDVTQIEEALLRAEELSELKTRLIMSVAHELRTPLTSVVGFSALLEDSARELAEAEVAELVGLISITSQQMGGILEDLLTAARAGMGELSVVPAVIDLTEVSTAALRIVDNPNRLIVTSGESVLALADPGRVRQIIRNLVTNAIRYGEGSIHIEVDSDGDVAALRVRDEGPGVPAEHAGSIFDAYWRGDNSIATSLGVGLQISLELARRMDGDLTYRREGDETVFELTLPLPTDG